MTAEEYKAARIRFGCSVEEWTQVLGVSRSLHGKLTGGFTPVSNRIAAHILLLELLLEAWQELSELDDLIFRADVRDQLYRF